MKLIARSGTIIILLNSHKMVYVFIPLVTMHTTVTILIEAPLKIITVFWGCSLWSAKNSFEVSGTSYLERRLLIGVDNLHVTPLRVL